MSSIYLQQLQKHYEKYFSIKGSILIWPIDPQKKMPSNFKVIEFAPNIKHKMWTYCTIGMSAEQNQANPIELFVFSKNQNRTIAELLTLVASFHINNTNLDLNHTVNIGRPWLPYSVCDHGFISLPYIDGADLELFAFGNTTTHCYWFIPITKDERDYKIANGAEALEQLFENNLFDYLNPLRKSLV